MHRGKPWEDTEERHYLKIKERNLRINQACSHLDLGL